ncbi:amidohydrolase family protein [Oceanobacillus sojae]|uniref:amidohydrolase family protein n=1 Tax=Oceanobacillus sojae TaxID=582851 RepID=UPI0021A79616|nr:amidohydrolase family protein [Oceanobacillus sojae]MCT1904272.1 amidohydrolase family protein [Oceanobacillus sojae]
MTQTAITNINTYSSESGSFSKKTLIIKDEKIDAILPGNHIPDHTTVINGSDLFLTPGFIDTCSQIGLTEKGIRWEGNDSTEPDEIKSEKLHVLDGIYPFDKAFNDAVSSGVTAAHIVSSAESIVGARTAVIHTYGPTVEDMVLHKKLGYSYSMGDVPKKTFWERTGTPLTRMGIAHKIRRSLTDLQKEKNLEEELLFIRCHRADDIATAYRIAEEFGIDFVFIHATEYRKLRNPILNYPKTIVAGPYFQPIERAELKTLDPADYYFFHKQAINYTFSTDHPTNSVTHLQLEGSLAVKNGVPEQQVLNALTKDAAKLLNIEHKTGDIQKGLFADLVLWNGHPLSLTSRAVRTFIKGKEVYREGEKNASYI